MIATNHPTASLTSALATHIRGAIEAAGGWIGFDRFMEMVLYTPGWGYYASEARKFGVMPTGVKGGGGDFVTAPEMSPHFGRALACQIAEALAATGTADIWEFGAGSGALAEQLLQALGNTVERYNIVELSASLRQLQQTRLKDFAGQVHWVDALPEKMNGVVVGNEVLDAMPVKLLARVNGVWHERGLVMTPTLLTSSNALPPEGVVISLGAARREIAPTLLTSSEALRAESALIGGGFVYADQVTDFRPPLEIEGSHDYLTEIHPQAEGFIRTLADRLQTGAVFLLDYGFPEQEYYHPQRSMGTVMCHRSHMADADALADVGSKDITAHVNFTGIALAAQDAGMHVLGYTGQGRFLLNCGLMEGLENASLPERVMVQRLVAEHEMGELFKVIGLAPNKPHQPYSGWHATGFALGDRTHTL